MQPVSPETFDAITVLTSIPGCHLFILPDAPKFTIMEATNAYLAATYQTRDAIIGRGIFEVFTDDPQNSEATGVTNLKRSLYAVLEKRYPDRMLDQRYDVMNPQTGAFECKIWSPLNTPVKSATGELQYIIHTVEDLTEKVRLREVSRIAEEKLDESEQRFRKMVEQSPVAMCVLRGNDLIIEAANPVICSIWGRSETEVMGKPLIRVIPEAQAQGFETILKQVLTGESFSAQELPVQLLRNGKLEEVFLDFNYNPLREPNGAITGVLVVAVDVTGQVSIRKRIEEREEQYRNLFNSIDQGFCVIEMIFDKNNNPLDYLFLEVNPNFEKQTGIQNAQGKTMRELVPDHDSHWFDIFGKVAITGQSVRFEEYSESLDKWFDLYAFRIGSEARRKVAVLFSDTSRRKQFEAELQKRVQERTFELESQKNLLDNILINSSNGISVTEMVRDHEGNVIDADTILANDAAVKFTGLPREEYLSKKATEIDPNILKSPYGKMCLDTLKTGEPSFSQYYLEMTGRWLELTISKMDDDHLIHIFTDVTAIKEAQLQLERTIEDLQRTNQNLEEFAYAASHDMKEPIRKMHFFADRLKLRLKDKLEPDERLYFERMERNAQRMGQLIDDLLAYSNVSRGTMEKETVDLNDLLQRVLEDLELEISDRSAIIQADPLPTINGYKRQLQQLLQNLVSNGLKYGKPGISPEISIGSRKVNGNEYEQAGGASQEYYLLSVRDNGIGFDQKDAARIFNVFTRLHGNSEYKGTGVGLAIADKVVKNHGGRIWAESVPGDGASFFVLLPVA